VLPREQVDFLVCIVGFERELFWSLRLNHEPSARPPNSELGSGPLRRNREVLCGCREELPICLPTVDVLKAAHVQRKRSRT